MCKRKTADGTKAYSTKYKTKMKIKLKTTRQKCRAEKAPSHDWDDLYTKKSR